MQGRGTDEEGEGSIAAEATLESGSLTTCQLTSSACPPEGESLCGKERLLQFVDLPSLSTMVSGGEEAEEREELCSAKSCPAWRSIARRMLWIAGEERIITPKQVLRNRDMDRRVPPRCAQQEACLARVMSYPLRPNTVAT